MATIYRKTHKGQTEIETRQYRLAPRLRTALILVDGRRTDAELAKLIPADPESALGMLLHEGFIESQAAHEHRAAAHTATAAGAPTPSTTNSFEQHRRDAIKSLTDQIGPMAEALAIRMERCTSWNQLLPVLQLAQQVLKSSQGAEAASAYVSRFIDNPPG
jgi:hypothetical protein